MQSRMGSTKKPKKLIPKTVADVENINTVTLATNKSAIDRGQFRNALGGSGDLPERRVDTIIKIYDYLCEHGTAEKSDSPDVINVDVTGYDSPKSIWSNMVKEGSSLWSHPGVEPPNFGMSTWRFSGPDESDDPIGEFDDD